MLYELLAELVVGIGMAAMALHRLLWRGWPGVALGAAVLALVILGRRGLLSPGYWIGVLRELGEPD